MGYLIKETQLVFAHLATEGEVILIGRSFGQHEPLTTRLYNLVRSYPKGLGVLKEFIQNADDAEADEIVFVIDEQQYDVEGLPDGEYIFLHVVGHALHMALTKNIEEIPESFLPVFEVTFGTQPSKVNRKDWPDIFADSFSIAVSYKTPLHKTNPFCQEFADFSLAGLAAYFKLLTEATLGEDLSKPVDMDWTTERVNVIKKSIEEAEE